MPFAHHRQVIASHHDVLRRRDDRIAVGGTEDVMGGHHQRGRLDLRFDGQRKMNGHLVAVEIRIEALAGQRMQADRVSFHQNRLKRLNADTMKRGSTVQQNRMIANDFIKDVPDILVTTLQHPFGTLNRVCVAQFLQAADHKWLEQLKCNFLGQPALMKFQFRADDDHASGRIVNPFPQQVFAEPTLLTLNHVRQRLQRPIGRTKNRSLAAVVVEQSVNRLLQHSLFVAGSRSLTVVCVVNGWAILNWPHQWFTSGSSNRCPADWGRC